MTRYDVTVSNFLWIADCCIKRTFIMRIIRIFFKKIRTYFYVFYFIVRVPSNSGPRATSRGEDSSFPKNRKIGKNPVESWVVALYATVTNGKITTHFFCL